MPTLLKVGRYEVLEELGRGAMGVVYKAFDPTIGRTVAVKTLRLTAEGTGMTRPELVTRFQTEARAAGLLAHPNIVVVHDAGEEEGLFYIIMEHIEGRSLQALLDAKQSFPLPRTMRLMEQACSALEYAHQHSVVHRDIKPGNLMLTPDDTVKVTDFGTAKILQFGTAHTAHIIGTPSYMSPEQVKGKPVDGRSDIFSLGVILYELVTGEKPFPGQNITTVIYKIINEDPIPPRELDSSVHPGLSHVITRALAKEPAARYATSQDLMEALHNYRELGEDSEATLVMPLRSAGSQISEVPKRGPVVVQTPATSARRVARATDSEPGQRRGDLWLALMLVAIIAGAGYHIWPYVRDVWRQSHATLAKHGPKTIGQPEHPATIQEPNLLEPPSAVPAARQPSREAKPAEENPMDTRPVSPPNVKTTAPSKDGEAPPPLSPSAELKMRMERRLAEAGLDDKVQVNLAGNTITLSGRLTPREHRQLLNKLHNTPQSVRLIDHIEYKDPEPAETSGGAPLPTDAQHGPDAAVGWAFVRTSTPGAEIWVDDADTGQHTPARLELSPGEHTVAISLQGNTVARQTILVEKGQTVQVNFQLQ